MLPFDDKFIEETVSMSLLQIETLLREKVSEEVQEELEIAQEVEEALHAFAAQANDASGFLQ